MANSKRKDVDVLIAEMAKIRSSAYYALCERAFEGSVALGTLGLRSIILLNGGAILAMLTFIGNSSATVDFDKASAAISYFAAGLISSLFAILCGYAGQLNVESKQHAIAEAASLEFADPSKVNEYLRAAHQSHKRASKIYYLAILFAVLATILFALGSRSGIMSIAKDSTAAGAANLSSTPLARPAISSAPERTDLDTPP